MIAATSTASSTARSKGFEALEALHHAGYRVVVRLEPTEPERHPRIVIKVDGPEEPPDELRKLIAQNRDALKAAALLSEPPAWLETLLELWFSGPKTSVRHICAAVAAAIGVDALEGHTVREEVEEALGSWEGRGCR